MSNLSNYHIYQEQAKGKYSVIFKARKKKRLQFMAIKRIQKTRKAKVFNQAKMLSNLNHPNIIKFYDFIETKNHMWQITQYCPGGDLLKLIQYDKILPENTVRNFIIQIMKGMIYCHSKGIIVCDIKPASILINEYGNLKIADFGSAQFLTDLLGNFQAKKKGTPSYMAPQLLQNGGVYSFQSDLWALGCMMYQLAQGNPPFVSTNFNQIVQLAKNASTPQVQFFSSDFNNLLTKLLEKDPSRRIKWPEVIQHSWIGNQIEYIQVPIQQHFLQYEKINKKLKGSKLRISTNLQNYNNQTFLNDRRQQVQFEAQQEINQYEMQQNKMNRQNQNIASIKNINFNMLKKNNLVEKKQVEKNKKRKLQDSSNINQFMQNPTNKPNISFEQAINHQSDIAVKPIIGNKDIELVESFNYNKKNLGFPYIQPQVLAQGILNGQMQNQLNKILQGMKGQQKINVLGYFQTLVQNSQIANYLFKSQFVPYYMALVKNYKHSSFRAKICEILGLLIRHATSIQSQILKYGIIPGFVEAITKQKSQKVKRKAMAALGQLLFYGATQVDQNALEWDIPLSLISTLLKILKNPNQDQIVRIYCCKSIQNITAQAQKVGRNFSQIDTLIVMISSYNSTQNLMFRTSIMCCIHHMITLNSTLRQMYLDTVSISSIIQTLNDTQVSTKTIQIILWIFLQQFLKNIKSKHSKSILENKQLTKVIVSFLDNSNSVVKGRVYLYIYQLLQYDFKKIYLLVDSKLFQSIQRHNKQSNKYQSQGIQFLVSQIFQNFPKILKYAYDQLQYALSSNENQLERNQYISIIYQMQNCIIFEGLFNNFHHIQTLLTFLNLIDCNKSVSYMQNVKNQYFIMIQKIFSNSSITQKLQQEYACSVLPFLIGKIIKSKQSDIRYSCVKTLIIIVNFLLSEQFLYDSTILTSTSTKVLQLISQHIIPQIDSILDEKQPMLNTIMLRLTSQLFTNRQYFVKKYCSLSNLQKILQLLDKQVSIHIFKTVQNLFQTKQKYINKQKTMLFLYKTINLLNVIVKQNNQYFYQYPLSILISICSKYDINLDQNIIDYIFECVVILQSHSDKQIKQKSELLISILLQKGYFSQKSFNLWKNLTKKGKQNYQKFIKLSGLKSNLPQSYAEKNNRQSRYN